MLRIITIQPRQTKPSIDEALLDLFPENDGLGRWLTLARDKIQFQGLPARICWLGYGERDKAGLAFNELVAKGIVRSPLVIGRDHLDSGSVASPYRETEAMKLSIMHTSTIYSYQ